MTDIEAKVVAAWQDAARDLGIRFTSPFTAQHGSAAISCLGLVHQFGRRIGTIISVLDEPSSETLYPADDDFFPSRLSDSYARYDRQFFIDTLNDWQFFGADAEKPVWYTGKSWS
jgi:hypothetical protein